MISGSKDAYTYLPESVRKFPDADGLADQMRDAGFVNVRFERMTAGIVALHLGQSAGVDSARAARLPCGIICFTVIDASASVRPIMIATETHATAL